MPLTATLKAVRRGAGRQAPSASYFPSQYLSDPVHWIRHPACWLLLALVLLVFSLPANAGEAEKPAAPNSVSFDLISVDHLRLPWTSLGPKTSSAETAAVLSAADRPGLLHISTVVSDDGSEIYYLNNSGTALVHVQDGLKGQPKAVTAPPGAPPLSSARAMAWDTARGVLLIVSSSSTATQAYRYDTKRRQWLGSQASRARDVVAVAADPMSEGFIAVTAEAELLMLNALGEVVEVRPLKGDLEDIQSGRARYGFGMEGLQIRAQGQQVALINVRDAKVTHVWVYDLVSRQVQLSYRNPALPAAAPTVPTPGIEKEAALVRGVTGAQSLTWVLMHPSVFFANASPAVQARILLVALACTLVVPLLLALQAARPAKTRARRILAGLGSLLLAVMAITIIWVLAVQEQRHPLAPSALLQTLQLLIVVARGSLPLEYVVGPEWQLRLATLSACSLFLMVMLILLAHPKRRKLRLGLAALAGVLAFAPAKHLWARQTAVRDLATDQAAGAALFESKCRLAGAKRRYAVGAVEGIRLTSLRLPVAEAAYTDPNWPDAGIPGDLVGNAYIRSFLDFKYTDTRGNPAWSVPGLPGAVTLVGYRHVDVLQPDGSYLRHRLAKDAPGGVATERIPAEQAARYAVSYSSLGDPEDRSHWVAGAHVKVTDTQTDAVIGELTVFAHAPPMRVQRAHREQRNWLSARTCPAYSDVPGAMVRMFTEEVLQRPRH